MRLEIRTIQVLKRSYVMFTQRFNLKHSTLKRSKSSDKHGNSEQLIYLLYINKIHIHILVSQAQPMSEYAAHIQTAVYVLTNTKDVFMFMNNIFGLFKYIITTVYVLIIIIYFIIIYLLHIHILIFLLNKHSIMLIVLQLCSPQPTCTLQSTTSD